MIYLNNSSFYEMSCARRYYYRVVKGAAPTEKSDSLIYGTFFHRVMQSIGPETTLADLTLINKPKGFDDLPLQVAVNMCQLALKLFRENPAIYGECEREHFFEYESPYSPNVTRCGTADVLSFNGPANTIDVYDYKTTAKPINGGFYVDYALKSQPYTYMICLKEYAKSESCTLPDKFKELLAAGRVRFAYIFVKYNEPQLIVVNAPIYAASDALNKYSDVILEHEILAAELHKRPIEFAVKQGMFNGACYRCPYKFVCSKHDADKEAAAIEKWPGGLKPYNPKHDDE